MLRFLSGFSLVKKEEKNPLGIGSNCVVVQVFSEIIAQLLLVSYKVVTKGMIQEGSSSMASSPLQYLPVMALSPGLGSPYELLQDLKPEERGLCLIHLILACANHVATRSIEHANITLEHISLLSSPIGDTMQRIAAYFTEALADRLLKGFPGLYKALNSTKISTTTSEQVLAQRLFFDLLPFLKLSYLITNQAIMEAMEGEKMVHIIDLHSSEPAQWVSLLRALSALPQGPPHLRITGLHERKEVLDQMASQLNKEAEKFDIPFQFNPIVCKLEDLDVERLRVKTGEALAISSVLQLHSLLEEFDDGVISKNIPKKDNLIKIFDPNVNSTSIISPNLPKMGTLLKALCGLSPKLMVVTEQESNHNGRSLMERVVESLNFYAALFDCLETSISRGSIERQKLEKMMFGEEIKNVIACEGDERKARHEKLDKWVQRMELAGFGGVQLSYHGVLLARRFLHSNGYDGYNLREENGRFFICWQDRRLYSISAWRFRMYD